MEFQLIFVTVAPARQAVKYDRITFDGNLDKPSPFRGPPSDQLDAAWSELMKHSSIRLTASALESLNRTSIKLADESGDFMGEMNVSARSIQSDCSDVRSGELIITQVHHHLHCLKYVRDYLHYDYYESTHEFEAENLLDHIGNSLIIC